MNTTPHTACIILPTYNEAENITKTLELIAKSTKGCAVKVMTLVVDDNSPDGTAKLATEYAKAHGGVSVLHHGKKEGLGAAYIAGMQHAIATFHPDIILEMDADGQHNPADIPRLIQAIEDGADFVIGSRYVPGGSVPKTWKAHRKLISRSANLYTKLMLSTGSAKDCTGGFRAIKSSILQKVDLSTLEVKGFAFQVTLLDACVRNGAKVKEVPIAFLEREQGTSKMRPKDMIGGGLLMAKIRARRIASFTRRKSSNNTKTTQTTAATSTRTTKA